MFNLIIDILLYNNIKPLSLGFKKKKLNQKNLALLK